MTNRLNPTIMMSLMMRQQPKRLHFHNPPSPDQKTGADSGLPSVRAVTENNFEPRHGGTENKSGNKTTHKIAHRITYPYSYIIQLCKRLNSKRSNKVIIAPKNHRMNDLDFPQQKQPRALLIMMMIFATMMTIQLRESVSWVVCGVGSPLLSPPAVPRRECLRKSN